MASSPTLFPFSSPISPNTRRKRRSKFTYKHLSTLSHSSPHCPLRVIAHIDLDAFYAQCETVRLGISPDKPLAVQQWQGLIAINYPARAYGLNRHVTITEAKEKCPEIICQHVATWKEGDTKWSYNDDAFKEIATRKVSLDPYRMQSRKILELIKKSLPADKQKVEKASIDEVFLDLSGHVHSIMLDRYPELQGPPPYDDPSEPLPRPPTTALDWQADALVDLDSSQTEDDDPDWDDVCMLIASEIVRDVRKTIFEQLHYTCSAGLSRNKMLAKLGSGHKKPNSQTVIRNRAAHQFLSGYKFTKIRNLGGKLGDEVIAAYNTDTVSDLLPVSLEQMKKQLGDDTGSWLYNTIRGEDYSEVNPRTQIKSMLSAKSFRPSINSFEVGCKWLRIFVADIFSRLVEEGVLENKRRPKTINLHHRQGAQTRSKQAPISLGKAITEEGLFEMAKNLLAQVIVDGRAWPCSNLSLSVGGFEDGVKDNKGIGGFLVRGDEAKALNAGFAREDSREDSSRPETPPPAKRRKFGEAGAGIARFFGAAPTKQDSASSDKDTHMEDGQYEDVAEEPDEEESQRFDTQLQKHEASGAVPASSGQGSTSPSKYLPPLEPVSDVSESAPSRDASIGAKTAAIVGEDYYQCERCNKHIPLSEQAEHTDFHFAQDLQNEHSSPARPPPKPIPPTATASDTRTQQKPKGRGRPPAFAGGGIEKGQKKLAFG